MKILRMTLTFAAAALIAWGGMLPAATLAEAWTGRTTANVNLRSAPGLHGAVITGLPQGTLLRVHDEQSGWVKVSHEADTFGYQGWVYGQFVMPVDALPAVSAAPSISGPVEVRPSAPSAPATGAAAVFQADRTVPAPLSTPVATPVVAAERPMPASIPAPVAIRAVPAVQTTTPATPAPAPIQAEADKAAAMGAQETVTLPEPPATQEILTTQHPARPATTPVAAGPAPSSTGNGVFGWVSLLLRLSTVSLACLALFVANRALQTAREASIRFG